MLKQIAAASILSVLIGQTLPASAQYDQPKTETPSEKPSAEVTPAAAPAETPSAAPSTETRPSAPEMMPTEPSRTPSVEMTPTTPSTAPSTETTPSTPSAAPSTEMQPTSPSTPSTEVQPTAPSTSVPVTPSADAKPPEASAKTMVLEKETITGIKEISFPTPPVTPAFFTLPMQLKVVKDTSITSNTPITDRSAKDISAWAAAVRACAADRPAFVRVVGSQEVPFMINGSEGKVQINANDRPVCSA